MAKKRSTKKPARAEAAPPKPAPAPPPGTPALAARTPEVTPANPLASAPTTNPEPSAAPVPPAPLPQLPDLPAEAELDRLSRRHQGVKRFTELLDRPGVPRLALSAFPRGGPIWHELQTLACAYDAYQHHRGDARRAVRG